MKDRGFLGVTLGVLSALLCFAVPAQAAHRPHMVVRHAALFGISGPMEPPRVFSSSMPSPTVNVQGESANCCSPSDANGAAGPTRYVQIVNTRMEVFDKSGSQVQAPVSIHALWANLTDHTNPCYTSDGGDPVVLYDHLANRWLISQLGFSDITTGPYYECIAVSQTGDPTGSYYAWAFQTPTYLGDYPKFGLWPDAYYMSVNQFTNPDTAQEAFKGAGVAAFDRSALLTGDASARMVYIDTFATQGTALGGLLPADWDGATPPSSNEANPFVQVDNTQLEVWQFHVDWTTTANSTFTHATNLGVSAFSAACCIKQPAPGANLDSLSDRLMSRLAYRNYGGYESLVVDHAVEVASTATPGTNAAGVRWYELRNSGSGWAKTQEGTYAPDDGVNRWMGSIAADRAGDMALGFSASSASVYPDIRYVGRLAADAAGTLPQTEIAALTASAYSTSSRWGDYSSMSIDPADDCTFWYTGQYMPGTGGTSAWTTRVVAFKFPDCVAQSVVLPAASTAPSISGTPNTGQTLTASVGTWTGVQPFTATTYEWQQCTSSCATSSHDTGTSSYVLDSSDAGKTIKVVVTRTNEIGSGSGTSAATAVTTTLPVNSVAPTITGTVRDGETVTATNGTWSNGPIVSYAYQWQRCTTSSSSSCADISGATASTYTLVHGDADKWVRVGVVATNSTGAGQIAYSSLSAVAAIAPANTALPTISGTAQDGQSLAASTGTWSGSPATYAYSWGRCDSGGASCSAIASGSSYALTSGDVGHTLRVTVTATNGGGSAQAVSAASAVVAAAPSPPAPPAPAPSPPPSSGGGGGGSGGSSGIPPDIHVDVTASSGSSVPAIGTDLLVFITVSSKNVGGSSDVRLDLTLPSGWTYDHSYADRGPGCLGTAPLLTCDVGFINAGTVTHVTLFGKVAQAGELDFTATATSQLEPELDPKDNTLTLKLGVPVAAPPAPAPPPPPPAPPTSPAPLPAPHITIAGTTLKVRAVPGVKYQWQLCTGTKCVPIKGATKPTLKLVRAYIGKNVRVVETRSGKSIASYRIAVKGRAASR